MGYIELCDGINNRRIPVPELVDPLRIEVAGDHEPRIVVPQGMRVDRVGESSDERVIPESDVDQSAVASNDRSGRS